METDDKRAPARDEVKSMKKLIALLIAALMALLPALAEATDAEPAPTEAPAPVPNAPTNEDSPNPFGNIPERTPANGQGIEIEVGGEKVMLDFDPSEQYSSIDGGLVQASFYSYSADGAKLYELYVIFPDSAQAGSVIVPDAAHPESSVVLIVSDLNTQEEQYYFSSIMNDTVYPEGSDFAIAVDDVQVDGGASTYTGRLTATLIALDMATGEANDALQIDDTPFEFTIGSTGERHADPLPTEAPKEMVKT